MSCGGQFKWPPIRLVIWSRVLGRRTGRLALLTTEKGIESQ